MYFFAAFLELLTAFIYTKFNQIQRSLFSILLIINTIKWLFLKPQLVPAMDRGKLDPLKNVT